MRLPNRISVLPLITCPNCTSLRDFHTCTFHLQAPSFLLHIMSSPIDSTPANSEISEQSSGSEDYALDKEISLDKIKSADEALAIIQGSGFFDQSLYSFVVLTSVDHEISIDLKTSRRKVPPCSKRIILPEESYNTENAKLYRFSPACVVCPTADPLEYQRSTYA